MISKFGSNMYWIRRLLQGNSLDHSTASYVDKTFICYISWIIQVPSCCSTFCVSLRYHGSLNSLRDCQYLGFLNCLSCLIITKLLRNDMDHTLNLIFEVVMAG